MGVSALFMSTVAGFSRHIGSVEFVVFDNGLGCRGETLVGIDGKEIRLIRFGARGGRRYYRPENLATMLFASRLGKMGGAFHEGIRLIDSCSAVIDISGGDSFSDIYGRARFDNIYRPKAIAINRGKPLILLPQTYGPYWSPPVRALAASVVRKSSMAWARDAHSFEILKSILGETFNPVFHRQGVDMAFSLPPSPANHLLSPGLNDWLGNKSAASPLVGFNISGLIYNDPEGAKRKYGLKADYQQTVIGFLQRILAETPARIVLIPHVMDQTGHYESDMAACQDAAMIFGAHLSERVRVAPVSLNQSQVKWLIAQMDWFCGTRMHSTIAGLSSGVPTATISYSDKANGVFATCDQESQVFDPRMLAIGSIIDGLIHSFHERNSLRQSLFRNSQIVVDLAEKQLSAISQFICEVEMRGYNKIC
jgi:colanic acid/amylovoran biosynthesis protein